MQFYPPERIGIFIDGADLFATARALGLMIDYARLLAAFGQMGRLVCARYYLNLANDPVQSTARALASWLAYNGYTVVTAGGQNANELEGQRLGSSLSMKLTVDALMLADGLDHVVLFSGFSGYCPLARCLQRKGRRISVVSTIQANTQLASANLRRAVDQFIDLADLKSRITSDPLFASTAPVSGTNSELFSARLIAPRRGGQV